jgi:hypothetical protein
MSNNNSQSQPKQKKNKSKFGMMMKFGIENINIIKFFQTTDPLKNQLGLINMELGKMDQHDLLFVRRAEEFDHAMLLLNRGKWLGSLAFESNQKADWKKANAALKECDQFVKTLSQHIMSGSTEPIPFEKIPLTKNDTEISFAGEMPVLPSISPVVILQGSDYDMGYQYAQQLVQIFGPWILERKAGRNFSEEEREIIGKWEEQIKQHAPEIIGLSEGWAAGATDAGVPMSYLDVIELWTSHNPPMEGYFGEEGMPELGMPLCSGTAAWGRATKDGELVTASSGDHDPGFTVTVVALPETGNSFMFCPFGATGDVPKAGQLSMFGHPGMNSKGVTYVHHGGGPKWVEPKQYWGYGIRRAVSVMHVLRFANSAREALEIEMALPIGDIGVGDPGHPGGFYADSEYGYVVEGRKDPVIIREAGVMGETDFLYAANAPIHPDIAKAPWRQTNNDQWDYDPHGGWYPNSAMSKINFQTMMASMKEPHIIGVQFAALNSYLRGRYMYNALNNGLGNIDIDFMKAMFRQDHPIPSMDLKELRKTYDQGEWGDISPANATNALVVITKPSEGYFTHCVGPARRGMAPMSPKTFANPIYAETNTFWDLKLEDTPEAISDFAKKVAGEALDTAQTEISSQVISEASAQRLNQLLETASEEFGAGQDFETSAKSKTGSEAVYDWAKATRAFTRSQVRARQVINTLIPTPSTTKEFA